MKVISLQAENVKRLKAVAIAPSDNLVEITGKNAQGKTSVLDALWWALAGKDALQSNPIRRGEESALIKLDLGTLKVTRKFKATDEGGYTTTIAVESPEGAKFGSPQAMLDALVGELSFDPLGFTRMKPAQQLETLKQFVPGVDFDEIERQNKSDYDQRTVANRRAKELRAQAEGMGIVGAIPERIDESALVTELESAGQIAATIEQRKAGRAAAEQQSKALTARLAELAERRAEYQRQIEAINQAMESSQEAITSAEAERAKIDEKLRTAEALPEPPDTSAIRAKIDEARTHNGNIAALTERAKRKDELSAEAKAEEAKATKLSKAMEARTKAKADAIAAAKLPVDGITFAEGGVLLDGLPFDQASDAQQLRASIAIASAMQPKLRVIRVRDGSLLDSDSMALLAGFAEENDMQVWIETVQSGRPGAVIIEDGQVQA